eukprot:gene45675-56914_t
MTIPSSITTITANMFDSSGLMTSFTLQNTVTAIGASAFKSTAYLATFTIGAGSVLATIGTSAFESA